MYGKLEKLTERLLTKLIHASFKLGEYNPPPSILYLGKMNDRKSVEEFKTYWTYSWGNFSSKISPTCLFKELLGRKPVQIQFYFRGGLFWCCYFPFSPGTPVFHLDAYSTLHRKTLTRILPFGTCELCDFLHDNYIALTGISKRGSLPVLSWKRFLQVLIF